MILPSAHPLPARRLRRLARALPGLCACLGCAEGPALPATTSELPWAPLGELVVGAEGTSTPVRVPVENRAVWLRVRAPRGERACLQIDEVVASNGEALAAPREGGPWCRRCRRRNAVVPGSGAFAMASDPGAVSVRVGLRDCDTLLAPWPARALIRPLTVDTIARAEIGRGVLRVQLVVAVGGDAPGAIEALARTVAPWFDDAGVRLAWAPTCRVADAPDPTPLGPTDAASLAAVKAQADARCGRDPRALRVYFVRAIAYRDPLTNATGSPPGVTTAIPAGLADEAAVDGVIVAAARALEDPVAAPGLSFVLAHELGHALGLFHSIELDGTDDDLADTDGRDLMNPVAAGIDARHFTRAQAARLRQHPLVQP